MYQNVEYSFRKVIAHQCFCRGFPIGKVGAALSWSKMLSADVYNQNDHERK